MIKFISLIGIIFIISITAFANKQNEVKIALNWKPEPQFGGFYKADFPSFVKLIPGGSGTPTIQMLLADQVQFAVVSGDEIIMSQSRGATDVIAIFATYQKSPYAIMVHDDNKYQKIDDILSDSELTLLWQSGLPYAQYLIKKTKAFKAKTAPYSGGITHFLLDKKIAQQCFVTSEPLLAQKKNLPVKTFLIADSGFNPYTTVVAVKRSYYENNRTMVAQIVKSLRKGWEQYLKNPQDTNKLMAKLNPSMDLVTFSSSAIAQKPLIQSSKIGEMSLERWSLLAEQLYEIGIIKAKVDPNKLFISL